MDMVYRKALRLNSSDVAAKGIGGVVNLAAMDVKKMERLPIFMFSVWEAPMQVRATAGSGAAFARPRSADVARLGLVSGPMAPSATLLA